MRFTYAPSTAQCKNHKDKRGIRDGRCTPPIAGFEPPCGSDSVQYQLCYEDDRVSPCDASPIWVLCHHEIEKGTSHTHPLMNRPLS